jgi:excisionase family DNA binding protein
MREGKEYLRASDVARLTGVSLRTVRRWMAQQVIPSSKLGGARFVAKADLEHLLSPFQVQIQIPEKDGGETES